ncbi:hypothetical protein [uncultured Muribaculum sp.]|uniref:hypothetical protein n=1 Tax=uncultured Muribaculum sp. TaxID=1918613 RepID=UPI0025A9CE3A|nr:hypothetical protein [uncultured Muribaculum sp.]
MYILLSHHTWNLSEVRYSRHHYPNVGEHRKRESSSGSAIPYLPIPRRGYMCGTTSCMIEIEFLQQQPEL